MFCSKPCDSKLLGSLGDRETVVERSRCDKAGKNRNDINVGGFTYLLALGIVEFI